jgi:dienelactone hydrolase
MRRMSVTAFRSVCLGTALLLLSGCAQTVKFATAYDPGSVSAHLARPTGQGAFPAVILLHGGTGIEPHHFDWSAWLAGEGYVAIVIDSLRRVGAGPQPIAIQVADARGALEYLRSLPFVDRERIAILGFSLGGGAALSSLVRYNDSAPPAGGYRAGVLFYPPGCSYRIERAEVPLLVFFGSLDGGAESCLDMSRRLQAKGGPPVTMVVYPNAYHAFDASNASTLQTGLGASGLMTVLYDPAATADARMRLKVFFAEHLRGAR